MITKYIPINSVLYDLSLTLDDRYKNETKMLEWIAHGLRQIPLESLLEEKVALLEVTNHKATLPDDFRSLTQIAYYLPTAVTLIDASELDLPENYEVTYRAYSYPWKAMRLSSSPYHNSICLNNSLYNCEACEHSFSISPSMVITTTLNSGTILVAYKAYPKDENGLLLMPDSESLKEALFHYALYRHWLSKYQMKEEGSEARLKLHLSMWNALKLKALSLNSPDVSTLENLKNIHNKLAPRTNRFDQLFLTLNSR